MGASLCKIFLKTAGKVSVLWVILVRIFPHSDWIRTDTLYLSVFSINMDTFYAVGFYDVRRQLRITEPKYHKKRNIRLIRLRFWCTINLFKGVLIKKTDFFKNNDVTLSWRVIKRSKLWKKNWKLFVHSLKSFISCFPRFPSFMSSRSTVSD